MAFERPITIREALDLIHRHEYVLPAIQREFTWKPDQICRLFDSLMLNYPIGSFLFWKVERERVRDYQFYDFVLNYHQKNAPHCPALDVPPDSSLIAVLDGQQRLTALNIGLRGSHTMKEPRKWWDNPSAFPTKRLYLNLLSRAEENEQGMQYDFRFLTEERASQRDETHFWFLVPKVLEMKAGPPMHGFLVENDLGSNTDVFQRIHDLHTIVHSSGLISYYLEQEQDLEKVVNVFIRVNSGGTVLSYSDLLLSIATAQWDAIDARSAIHSLVDELNETGSGFALSKDFVLKAGLMLADIASVGFRVTNFNPQNMAILQECWKRVDHAVRMAVQLASDFGFSSKNLSADSPLLVIAYYLYRRDADESYLTSSATKTDRTAIKQWLLRSLLKTGIWGSGLDTTLTALRTVIQEHGAAEWPSAQVEQAMAKRGRSLRFTEEEIEDLVDVSYGDKRVFSVLSLLYPFIDFRNAFHVDHVFPKSRFAKPRLLKAGVSAEDIDACKDRVNRLANLQLLEGAFNQAKNDQMPAEWIRSHFSGEADRENYARNHDLGAVPVEMTGFPEFFEARRTKIASRLRSLLGVTTPE